MLLSLLVSSFFVFMDAAQSNLERINLSLKSITLDAMNENIFHVTEEVLVRKLFSTRRFNKGVVANIVDGAFFLVNLVDGAWQTKQRVKVKQLKDDVSRFSFELLEDKMLVFEKRP